MKVYEFGKEHPKPFVMFQCAAEPWWVFRSSAEKVAKDYHVYLMIADGHDGLGTEFVSLEKYAKDAAEYLRQQGIDRVEAMYGVSMGGAAVIRFLATEDIPVEKAIIDAGITPYPYPKLICRLISVKDWIMIMLGTRSLRMMKLACPPERWTPGGEDPEEHYRTLLKFFKKKHRKEYEAMVGRTPSAGSMKDNMSAARNGRRDGSIRWTGSSTFPMTSPSPSTL